MRTVVDEHFRAKLLSLITASGRSQRHIADTANITPGYLSLIVNGQRTPSDDVARSLDDALNAGGTLVGLLHPWLSDQDADLFTAAVASPPRIGAEVVDSLARVLAANRDLDDRVGSTSMLGPVGVQLAQITTTIGGARGPQRPGLMSVAAQWAQFSGWLHISTGQFAEASRSLQVALQWAFEADSPDLVATILSYQAHVAWLQIQPAQTVSLAEAVLRTDGLYPGQPAYDAHMAARCYGLFGELEQMDRLLARGAELAAATAAWTGQLPAWQYQRDQWTWDIERGVALRYAAKHDPARYPAAIEALRAGVDGVPAQWRSADWYAENLVHLAAALMDGRELDEAAIHLVGARRIATAVSSPRVLQLVESRERRLHTARICP